MATGLKNHSSDHQRLYCGSHSLRLPITVLTRFRATSHHEWISRSVSRKPCSKQWTATSEKHSAVQTIKTRCSPMLKWNGNCWDGSWNCQEVAGKYLLAECSTARLHLERRSVCIRASIEQKTSLTKTECSSSLYDVPLAESIKDRRPVSSSVAIL